MVVAGVVITVRISVPNIYIILSRMSQTQATKRYVQTFRLMGIRIATAKTEQVANNVNDILKKLSNCAGELINACDSDETMAQTYNGGIQSYYLENRVFRRPDGGKNPPEERLVRMSFMGRKCCGCVSGRNGDFEVTMVITDPLTLSGVRTVVASEYDSRRIW